MFHICLSFSSLSRSTLCRHCECKQSHRSGGHRWEYLLSALVQYQKLRGKCGKHLKHAVNVQFEQMLNNPTSGCRQDSFNSAIKGLLKFVFVW